MIEKIDKNIASFTSYDLNRKIKVIKLLEPPKDLLHSSIGEMLRLKKMGMLTALRGNRQTDLARPVNQVTLNFIQSNLPNLIKLINLIEQRLYNSQLFLRALKIDGPRISTTSPSGNIYDQNIHFDAEKSSKQEWGDPIVQYYGNLGTEPRQFTIYPISLLSMVKKIESKFNYGETSLLKIPLKKILSIYLKNFETQPHTIDINSGELAIFDGRSFAHDGGKNPQKSTEPDFVMTLDSKFNGKHEFYDPFKKFLFCN